MVKVLRPMFCLLFFFLAKIFFSSIFLWAEHEGIARLRRIGRKRQIPELFFAVTATSKTTPNFAITA